MISHEIISEIKDLLGEEKIIFLSHKIEEFSSDGTKLRFPPDIVVFPECEEEVSEILKIANRCRIPVTVRGAGTGMSGGALPVKGGILMSMERMNKIIEIDRENMICIVEPGVITERIQEEVKKYGLFYPPYPASSHLSTIGGNVAECAGGLRAVKYGVTKDYVLGLRIVLPTGERLKTGTRTLKGVVGYDLTKLICGSEGTLAVITEITLRLIPHPEERKSLVLFFKDTETAIRSVLKILHEGIIPSILEFLDDMCLYLLKDEIFVPKDARSSLFVELDGERSLVKRNILKIKEICKEAEIYVAEERKDEERIWEARKNLSPLLYKIKPDKISEDIAVPISKIPSMVLYLKELSMNSGLPIPVFGHAGDGNLHVNIMLDKKDRRQVKIADDLVFKIFKKTLELGGTISAEHGIGITKAPYLHMEIQKEGIELMKRIKKAFDPNGILNPGKIWKA